MKYYSSFLLISILFANCSQHQDDNKQVHQLLEEAASKYEAEDYNLSWKLLDSAYIIAENQNYPLGQAEVLLNMSYIHYSMDHLDSVLLCLNHGLELCPDAPDSLLALYYSELTSTYISMGDMQTAVEWAGRTFPLIRRYGDAEEFAVFCGNTGVAYRRLGQRDSATVYYQRGFEVAIQAEDYASEAYLANNLSVLYGEERRLEEMSYYASKAEEAAILAGDDIERISAIANKGTALSLSKRYDEAIILLAQAFQQADSLSNTPLKLKAITSLLNSLAESQNTDDYSYYLQRADELAAMLPRGHSNAAYLLESKMNILCQQKRYSDALKVIEDIEKQSDNYELVPKHLLLYRKGQCLAGLGRYADAYSLQSESIILSDSVRNQESNAKLDELSTNYHVMKKELEVAQLNEKQAISQRRISQLLAVLAIMVSVIAVLLLWIRHKRQSNQIREAQRYIDGIEQERSRFAHELHDGACNELLAMGMQLRAANPNIAEVCQEMSSLRTTLRHLSHELMPPQFSQGVLLNEALAYYLSHIEKPVVNFQVEGSGWDKIPNNVSYQLYRIVQEAIGNIIVHQPEASAVVSLSNMEGHMNLSITSTGEVKEGDGKGIGMKSMSDRVKSIGGTITANQNNDVWCLKISL